jgi:undecaprenyl diphosphate synthase
MYVHDVIHYRIMNVTVRIVIRGRVQGVFMRKWIKRYADNHELFGTVENKKDGSVEVYVFGTQEKIDTAVEVFKKGSVLSKVQDIKVFPVKSALFSSNSFTILYGSSSYIIDKAKAFLCLVKNTFTRTVEYAHIPKHLVIIPDGNRRYAMRRKWLPTAGHTHGARRMGELVEYAFDHGVTHLTVWGFSTENWKRSKEEIDSLMKLFLHAMDQYEALCHKHTIRFYHFGRKDRIPEVLRTRMEVLSAATMYYGERHIAFAIDYGGMDEIIRAVEQVQEKRLHADAIVNCTDSAVFPPVDLVIRTGGEMRTSGILPLATLYAEYYFSSKYFPDFTTKHLHVAFKEFEKRKRRFGA